MNRYHYYLHDIDVRRVSRGKDMQHDRLWRNNTMTDKQFDTLKWFIVIAIPVILLLWLGGK